MEGSMYEVKKNGEIIAVVDKPSWIKRLVNGDMGLTTKEHATGIAISLGVFSLGKSKDMEDLEQVTLNERDAGEMDAVIWQGVLESEDALCDLDAQYAERISTIEDVLCELDEGGEL